MNAVPIETLEALAREVVDRRDRGAALVLGDALMERGLRGGAEERVTTGRIRQVLFRTRPIITPIPLDERILDNREINAVHRVVSHTPSFLVPAYQTLFNVARYARSPEGEKEQRWGDIWAAWFTPGADIYDALIKHDILPASIAPPELKFRDVMRATNEDELLAERLRVVRIPRRRKRPIETALFDVVRLDSDNPATRTIHFDQDTVVQLPLFERDRGRR